MSAIGPDKDRRLIPRWRSSMGAVSANELNHSSRELSATPLLNSPHFRDLQEQWKTSHSLEVASEIISCAIALGKQREQEVSDASRLILDSNVSAELKGAAYKILSNEADDEADREPHTFDPVRARLEFYKQISLYKRKVRFYPNNALAWSDLSRLYASVGQNKKATNAMHAALALASENRFVLRVSSRLFVHLTHEDYQDCVDEALYYLRRSRLVKIDPWVMAAEISVATLAGVDPISLKKAREIAKLDYLEPWDTSELFGALGTFGVLQGGIGNPRKFFNKSLREPTENALAQALWAADLHRAASVPEKIYTAPPLYAYEAMAQIHRSRSDWASALEACRSWSDMEPTSSRPLILGGYIAGAAMNDGELLKSFAERALITAPNDPGAMNNMAVAYAYLGKLEEAKSYATKYTPEHLPEEQHPVYWATLGLIAYREGDIQRGSELYLRASETPFATKHRDTRLNIFWHMIREEALLGTPGSKEFALKLKQYTNFKTHPEFSAMFNQIVSTKKNIIEQSKALVSAAIKQKRSPLIGYSEIEKKLSDE